MIVLGVDPGYHTGLAVVDTIKHKLIAADTISELFARAEGASLILMMEDYRKQHGYRAAVVQTPMATTGKTPMWNRRSPVSLAKNAALSERIATAIEAGGVAVQRVPPRRKVGMKMDAKIFAIAFGWKGRVSEHARDAANLAMQWREA